MRNKARGQLCCERKQEFWAKAQQFKIEPEVAVVAGFQPKMALPRMQQIEESFRHFPSRDRSLRIGIGPVFGTVGTVEQALIFCAEKTDIGEPAGVMGGVGAGVDGLGERRNDQVADDVS